jgi:hypothetical protein
MASPPRDLSGRGCLRRSRTPRLAKPSCLVPDCDGVFYDRLRGTSYGPGAPRLRQDDARSPNRITAIESLGRGACRALRDQPQDGPGVAHTRIGLDRQGCISFWPVGCRRLPHAGAIETPLRWPGESYRRLGLCSADEDPLYASASMRRFTDIDPWSETCLTRRRGETWTYYPCGDRAFVKSASRSPTVMESLARSPFTSCTSPRFADGNRRSASMWFNKSRPARIT